MINQFDRRRLALVTKIISLGVQIPGPHVTFAPFRSNASLADGDIVVCRPDAREFTDDNNDPNQVEAQLDARGSAAFLRAAHHWNGQLRAAVEAGKTVFVFLAEPVTLHLADGDTETARSGRAISSYDLAPVPPGWTARTGTDMALTTTGDATIEAYWARFGALSKHHVVWENHQKSASIQTAADRHPVGYVLTPGNSGGQLILFPDLPFEDIAPIPDDAGNRPNGPAAATGFADDLCRELLRLAGAPEPEAPEVAPDWAGDPRYRLPAEAEGRARIDAIEDQIRALEAQIEDRRREITEATRLKALLFASGPRLDAAVADALLALGFTTEPTDAGPSGLGPSFTCPEGRLLGVADSPEDGPVGLAKLREATFRLLEDAERDEVHDPAKAILFGSAHRLAPPAERPACFTEKCVRTAQATSLALCDTCDLFAAVRHVLRSGDDETARRMRVLLLTTSGEVKPDLPEGEGPRAT
ncbi:MAG TPA: hypothetical protein DDY29_15800 [Rhodobacteraceae bacterium]|jgi:hypothetical protein|nr:hypothetical protein [Paracoccaceae bacterium]